MAGEAVELSIVLSARDAASHVLEGVTGKVEGMGKAGQLAMIGVAALATSAVALVGGLFAMGESAAATADQVRKLARETGLTTEEASKLRFAGERLNIDTGALSKSLGIFSKGLEATHPKLAQYGIEVVKASDGHIEMDKTLANVADKFTTMPDGVEKTAIAMALFGKSGKDMIPLLNQGSAGLAAMGGEATKMGLVFSKEGVESARLFGLAQKDLSERFEGMKNTVGMAVLPIMTKLFDFLSTVADRVLPPLTEALGHVVEILGEVFGVITGQAPDAGAALTGAIGPEPAKLVMGALAGIRDTAKDVFEKVGAAIGFLKEHWDFFGPAFAAIAVTVIVPAMIAWGVAATAAAAATVIALLPVLVPLAAIGAAVGLLALAWNSNFGDIQGKTAAVVAAIQGFFDGLKLFVLEVWRGIVVGIAAAVNGVIGVIDGFIGAYNTVAEKLGLPLLGTISLITPNVDAIDAAINNVARDREARIFANVYEQAISGGGGTRVGQAYAEGTPFVPFTGPAIVHRGERIITAADNRAGMSGVSGAGADIVPHATLVLPDGAVLARTVERYNQGDQRRRGLVAEPFGV